MSVLLELVIYTLELSVPVGAGILYLASIGLETEQQEKAADQPGKSHQTWFGYRRGDNRYAHRFVAGLLGMTICVPLLVLLVWWIFRVFA